MSWAISYGPYHGHIMAHMDIIYKICNFSSEIRSLKHAHNDRKLRFVILVILNGLIVD